jgi:hypothetical protein
MQMQGFADQKCCFGDGVGGAVRENQPGLAETADRIADEIEQRPQFTGCDLLKFRFSAAARGTCSLATCSLDS